MISIKHLKYCERHERSFCSKGKFKLKHMKTYISNIKYIENGSYDSETGQECAVIYNTYVMTNYTFKNAFICFSQF